MGVYSLNESAILDDIFESVEPFEGEPDFNGACQLVAEDEENFNRFMKAIGISELAYLEENHQEVIYESGRISNLMNKAKEFFKKVLARIAAICKKFISKIDRYVLTNAAFVKKYRTKILAYKGKIEYTGYTFSHLDSAPDFTPDQSATVDKAKTVDGAKGIINAADGIYSTKSAKAKALGVNSISGDDFAEEIFKYFRSGDASKSSLSNINLAAQIKVLEGTKDLKKKAKDSYTKAHKAITKIIKDLEKAEKSLSKEDTKNLEDNNQMIKAVGIAISYYKDFSSAVNLVNGGYLRALSAQNGQAKAICTKAISGGYNDERDRKLGKTVGESFSFSDDDFLANLEF